MYYWSRALLAKTALMNKCTVKGHHCYGLNGGYKVLAPWQSDLKHIQLGLPSVAQMHFLDGTPRLWYSGYSDCFKSLPLCQGGHSRSRLLLAELPKGISSSS